MTIFDLSHDIHEKMPVYPGMILPKLEKYLQIKTNGYAETLITLLSHTGTHIDAPAHMDKHGKTLYEYEVESFIGKAIAIDVQGKREIELQLLLSFEKSIKTIDFVLFLTGWSDLWGRDAYFKGFPSLSIDSSIWLANSGIKGIGLDCISADIAESKNFPVHHTLFARKLLIVENLKNFSDLCGKTFMFSCLPLKYPDSDGSPVRAVAWI